MNDTRWRQGANGDDVRKWLVPIIVALIGACGAISTAIIARWPLLPLPQSLTTGGAIINQASAVSTTPATCSTYVETGGGTWGDYTVDVPDGCVLIVDAYEGHAGNVDFSDGGDLAFSAGQYRVTIDNGSYYIVPADGGRAKFCTVRDWMVNNGKAHSYQLPLPEWQPCS